MIYALIVLLIILIVIYVNNSISACDALTAYRLISDTEVKDDKGNEEEKVQKITLSLEQKMIFLFVFVVVLLLAMIFLAMNVQNIVLASCFSLAVSYIFVRVLANLDAKNAYKKYDFYLPIVMERLVMAVQGGNDVYAAVNIIVELNKKNGGKLDPVTKLLDMVLKKNKSGISFEDSLELVANIVNLTSIRHAFLHLGIAQKEGGEIVVPMEELSDSTQEYYQQTVEKEISVMPVKATLPLLVAFIGLITFFLSVPLTQIMTMDTMSAAGGNETSIEVGK